MPVPDHPLRHFAARPTPRLYLVKACVSLFVAFPLLALAAPARAGHWVLTTTGSGQAMVGSGGMLETFTPPPPSTNSVTINSIGAGWSTGPCFSGTPGTTTAKANLQVTVTGTWTSDTNSDNTAPPGVWLSESSTAYATCTNAGVNQPGSADDGLGDPVAQSGSQMGISAPPSGQKYVPQSAGSFTVNLTLSASASGTQGMFQGAGSASVCVGPITIAIHAQPYNFHKTSATDNGDGTLTFTYGWSSTSGNIGDLGSCYLHERVTYPGGNPYTPPLPFTFLNPLPNPTIRPGIGSSGISMTSTTGNSDIQRVWTPVPPYSSSTVTAQQQYEYDDTQTLVNNTVVPGPDSTASIVRTVGPRTPYIYTTPWWYSCTKQGVTAWLQLQ